MYAIGWAVAALATGLAVFAFLARVVRPWCMRWGATPEELARTWPGDELISQANCHCMHAITIQASPEQVWRWLIQVGQNRAGFYSYDRVERFFGFQMLNAERIHREWQQLSVGAPVLLHPVTTPLDVMYLEPAQALVMAGGRALQGDGVRDPSAMRLENYQAYTWSYFLEPSGDGGTRFVARIRASWDRERSPGIWHWIFLEPAHFIMQRGMHLGLKARVEREAGIGPSGGG